jgi:predicted ATPase
MIPALAHPHGPTGFQMIRSIDIQNFRCFEHLPIENVKRFNVIVGDNAAGKTALLEAIFLALSGNVEVSMRLRQQRGFESTFSGSPKAIEEAIWKDYFFNYDWRRNIRVRLNGDGIDNREMTIGRGDSSPLVPFEGFDQSEAALRSPILFRWIDAFGREHSYNPTVTQKGIQLGRIEEDLPDFFLFAANHTPQSGETAARFSQLSTERREGFFVDIFKAQYPFIEALSIEVAGGAPVIHASISGEARKQPLNAVSGGINRIVAIMLALAAERKSVVLVDEIEDGLYYRHKTPLWRGLLDLARKNDAQMFLTTHDEEWLMSLVEASANDLTDIALWRLERSEGGKRVLRQMTGRTLQASVEFQGEVR